MAQQILAADDDHEIGRLVRAHLDQAGFRAVCAFDGASSLRTLHLERPDLLVLDLILPDRDGLEIVRPLCAAPGRCNRPPTTRISPVERRRAGLSTCLERGSV